MTPFPGQAGSYGSHTPYPHGVALPQGSSYSSIPPYSAPLDITSSSYQGSNLGLGAPVDYARSHSSSISYQQGYPQQGYGYPQQGYSQAYSTYAPPYMGSAMSSSGMGASPTTIIIHKRNKKHRRSRSVDPGYSSSSRY
jgi:hypothetical protein